MTPHCGLRRGGRSRRTRRSGAGFAAVLALVGLPASFLPLRAQEETREPAADGFVGAQVCGACHAEQFAQQAQSAHAGSLSPAALHPLASSFTPATALRRGRFQLTYAAAPNELRVRIADGEEEEETPLEWAFGAGGQAVTFVSRLDEDTYVEHHFSYYSAAKSFAATPGHDGRAAGSLREALGVPYETFSPRSEIMRCFSCHSTGKLSLGRNFELQPAELGVRCEACHGPGEAHAEAVRRADMDAARAALVNPGRMDPQEQIAFCGNCHRPPASENEAIDWRDPWNVRHHPLYLSRSRCFLGSGNGLSCVTCHDPHRSVLRKAPAYYNSRCAGCHTASSHPPNPATCKTAGSVGCSSCHMPVVRPNNHLRFYNHWIGIYRNGDVLRPSE